MQPLGPPRCDQIFRAGDAVAGETGMGMEIDVERHWADASLRDGK